MPKRNVEDLKKDLLAKLTQLSGESRQILGARKVVLPGESFTDLLDLVIDTENVWQRDMSLCSYILLPLRRPIKLKIFSGCYFDQMISTWPFSLN
jgi:hypothetical protein